jgi:hypothetical protein
MCGPVIRERTDETGDNDVASAGGSGTPDSEWSATKCVDYDEAKQDGDELDNVHDTGENKGHLIVGTEGLEEGGCIVDETV